MVVNGKLVGIPLYGDCNASELENIKELANAIEKLKASIAKVFDPQIAEMKIRGLGDCSVTFANGDVNPMVEAALKALCNQGVIRTSRKEKQLSNVCEKQLN